MNFLSSLLNDIATDGSYSIRYQKKSSEYNFLSIDGNNNNNKYTQYLYICRKLTDEELANYEPSSPAVNYMPLIVEQVINIEFLWTNVSTTPVNVTQRLLAEIQLSSVLGKVIEYKYVANTTTPAAIGEIITASYKNTYEIKNTMTTQDIVAYAWCSDDKTAKYLRIAPEITPYSTYVSVTSDYGVDKFISPIGVHELDIRTGNRLSVLSMAAIPLPASTIYNSTYYIKMSILPVRFIPLLFIFNVTNADNLNESRWSENPTFFSKVRPSGYYNVSSRDYYSLAKNADNSDKTVMVGSCTYNYLTKWLAYKSANGYKSILPQTTIQITAIG